MRKKTEPTSDKPHADQDTTSQGRKTKGVVHRVIGKTSQVTGKAITQAREIAGKIQRKLGEDYYTILEENLIIKDTLSRADLLTEDEELLYTVFNIPWVTTLLWSAAAGNTVMFQRQIANLADRLAHKGPGHVKHWDAVNRFMDFVGDKVRGGDHRLKSGHSIEYLLQIIEQFGIEGVPAYLLHIVQDFMSPAGIPIVPNAWKVKDWLHRKGLSSKAATGLVSISFSRMLGAFAVITLVTELWKVGGMVGKNRKLREHLKNASAAVQNRDYIAAAANYKHALEIERAPAILMAMGQVYMQRAANRLHSHEAFMESVKLLADRISCTVPYGWAQLSLRGLAGIQALATADALAGIRPEFFNDHVRDLVNATVFSFKSVADNQSKQSEDLVPDVLVNPAHFSAAINYYLAAKSACYYPLAEEREETVVQNLKSALRSLGLVAQYDEEKLRQPTDIIGRLWATELLPHDEVETVLTLDP